MKNFFDCKDEKITEKAFSQSLIISVISILLCLVALCSITYAWFTTETTSNSNTITSGYFDITVVDIAKTDGEAETVVFKDGKYLLTEPGVYTVTLAPSVEATVKGYCVVTIDNEVYRTEVILDSDMVDETYQTPTAPFIFKIETNKADTIVQFEPHWGVLVDPDIVAEETISVEAAQTKDENDITE